MGLRPILVLIIAATAGLALSACSDDAEALSKSDLIEQADAVCQEANDDLEPIWEEYWSSFDEVDFDDPANQELIYEGIAELMAESVPRWEQQSDELRELVPPEEDAETIETLLDDFDAAIAEMAEISELVAAGDADALALIESDDDPLADVNQQAREYGMVVCGSEE